MEILIAISRAVNCCFPSFGEAESTYNYEVEVRIQVYFVKLASMLKFWETCACSMCPIALCVRPASKDEDRQN